MIGRGHASEEPYYLRRLESESHAEWELSQLQGELTYAEGRIRKLSSELLAVNCLTHGGDLVLGPDDRTVIQTLVSRVLELVEDTTQYHTYLSGRAAASQRRSARARRQQPDMS